MKIKEKFKKVPKKMLLIFFVFIAIATMVFFKFYQKDAQNYLLYTLKKDNITREINANGTINPVNVVDVGTQVSAMINKIYVDYNDKVKKDQILAKLDTSLLEQQVGIDKANLERAQATKDYNQINLKREQELFKNDYIAKSELDQATTNFKTAKSDYVSALFQYKKSVRNLNLATIKSPVSGVIIARLVQEGQTVASNLNAPSLFKIATDLTKMQIEASVSEADISSIKNKQVVSFTVDAYPEIRFQGIVNQIRLNPSSDQNVVTYTVVINIDNNNLELLPGMTAFVNIIIDKKENVLKVPNTVLSFQLQDFENINKKEKSKQNLSQNEVIIYKIDNNKKITAIKAKKGLESEFETEIISEELKEGVQIIQDILPKNGDKANKNNIRVKQP